MKIYNKWIYVWYMFLFDTCTIPDTVKDMHTLHNRILRNKSKKGVLEQVFDRETLLAKPL